MADVHANFAVSTVATAPSPATSGTSLVVASGHGTRFPTTPFNATICPAGTAADPSNAEIVRVTNRSTDTFTITRTQESTSARTVIIGDQIFAGITAKTLTDVESGPAGGDLTGTYPNPTLGTGAELAADYGYAYWSMPPSPVTAIAITKGVLTLTKVFVRKTITISNIYCYLSTAGVTLSNCFAGIYDSTGTLVTGTATADQSTPWQSTGHKAMAIGTPGTSITGGSGVFVWIGFLAGNGSTTSPQLIRRSGFDSTQVNMGLTAANYATAITGSTLTALPGSFTPGSLTNSLSGQFWGAIA